MALTKIKRWKPFRILKTKAPVYARKFLKSGGFSNKISVITHWFVQKMNQFLRQEEELYKEEALHKEEKIDKAEESINQEEVHKEELIHENEAEAHEEKELINEDREKEHIEEELINEHEEDIQEEEELIEKHEEEVHEEELINEHEEEVQEEEELIDEHEEELINEHEEEVYEEEELIDEHEEEVQEEEALINENEEEELINEHEEEEHEEEKLINENAEELDEEEELINEEELQQENENPEPVLEFLRNHIEALIFCANHPISLVEIKNCLSEMFDTEVSDEDIQQAIYDLITKYEKDEFSFQIYQIAKGYQFLTKPAYKASISILLKQQSKKRLSTAALETLSIIAYKQPVTKAEIEQIRGVGCDYAIHKLLEKSLIAIVGKDDTVGKPLLYGTSEQFIEYFGINTLNDLPTLKDFSQEGNSIGIESPEDGDDQSSVEEEKRDDENGSSD